MSEYSVWNGETYDGDPSDGWELAEPPPPRPPQPPAAAWQKALGATVLTLAIIGVVALGVANSTELDRFRSAIDGDCNVSEQAGGIVVVRIAADDVTCQETMRREAIHELGFTGRQVTDAYLADGTERSASYQMVSSGPGEATAFRFSER